ncbi:hypothetical protein F511_01287 [Dorcoceras hygrometricum]|uniref:Myb/SANT-like domain-containing protein n=1 Tax=Dorcoceras hygrometricum TaxID=472368 RepID=A0A2Z7BSN0_9LAMI|nr:hypothetical protein F511_01287 [Dorcoceras hygrometricum]
MKVSRKYHPFPRLRTKITIHYISVTALVPCRRRNDAVSFWSQLRAVSLNFSYWLKNMLVSRFYRLGSLAIQRLVKEMEPTPSEQMQGQGRKSDKSRRCWSMKEEEVLISALKDIVANGWKSENGFRTGYLIVLERVMVKAFPGTDLRAQPHINSKLHVWKKYHASLTCMLVLRGFSWNAKDKMVKAEDDAWESYLKVDSSARTMRYKSWPFYEDWCQIYGTDVPSARENIEDLADADQGRKTETGRENSEYLADADQGIKTDTGTDKGNEMTAEFGYPGAEGIDVENELSVCHSQDSGTKEKQPPKKRKVSSNSSAALVEPLAVFCETVISRLDEIAEIRGHERDVSDARKEVFGALSKIPGLSTRDMIIAARILVNRTPDMELFFSLPDNARAVMVNLLLADQH